MHKEKIINKLIELTHHNYIKLSTRGNSAIQAAIDLFSGSILIPEEGGWLTYKKIKDHQTVKCNDAVIALSDLKEKVSSGKYTALIYENPGGYFAEQPMQEIYNLCKEYNVFVILDVSGSIGTKFCNGNYADIMVGSFGRWKPVNAEIGGFISCKDKDLFNKIQLPELNHQPSLFKIEKKLNEIDERINYLLNRSKKIKEDLKDFKILHKEDFSLVVIVKFFSDEEKQTIIKYCEDNQLEWTLCPRYIRLNKPAISIEVKRL
jgi:hypothetical protein